MIKRAYADIPEGQIHYRYQGTGHPILLLHQTPFSSDEYTPLIPLLVEAGYRAIAIDTPGYGNSDRPPAAYRIEDYARAILSFLNSLHIPQVSVVGHHTGTSLAIELAAAWPERVNCVVLSGCSLYTPEERQARINDPRRKNMEITRDGAFITREWESSWSGSTPGMNIDIAYRLFAAKIQAGVHLHSAHQAAYRYEKEPKLRLIKWPVLVLSGSQDMFLKNLEAVRSLIPCSRSLVIEGAGNHIVNEKPREFANALISFFKAPGV